MIGIRSAISIRARGQWPLLEAVYMTAPRFIRRNTKKALAERGPSIHDERERRRYRAFAPNIGMRFTASTTAKVMTSIAMPSTAIAARSPLSLRS